MLLIIEMRARSLKQMPSANQPAIVLEKHRMQTTVEFRWLFSSCEDKQEEEEKLQLPTRSYLVLVLFINFSYSSLAGMFGR